MNIARCLIVLLIFFSVSAAQDEEFTFYPALDTVGAATPQVSFETDNLFLLKAFYPLKYENEYEAARDIRFAIRNDSSIVSQWDSLGTSIMVVIENLSGIYWVEKNLEVNLVKYLPVLRLYDPLAMPLEGIRNCRYTEAAPTGYYRLLNLIHIMSGRNLYQVRFPESEYHFLRNHPLLDQSSYRFDLMAMTLALEVAREFIPADSIARIISSDEWIQHNPGWSVYRNHIRGFWKLSGETPLVYYLSEESENSALVALTRPPRVETPSSEKEKEKEYLKFSAKGGRLGFSVARSSSGLLEIVDIDTTGLAFHSGLQVGDRIRTVNGQTVRTARELMSRILDKIDTDGVYLAVLRDGENVGVLLLPAEADEEH